MSGSSNEIDGETVAQFGASLRRLRPTAEQLLVGSRDEMGEYVDSVLAGEDRAVKDCCTEYYVNTLPNGSVAYDELFEKATRAGVTAADLVTAIATVQGAILSGSGPQAVAEQSPETRAAFARVITQDTAEIGSQLTESGAGSSGGRMAGGQTAGKKVDDLLERAEEIEASTFEIETLADQQADNTDNLISEIDAISSAIEEIAATASEVNEQSNDAQALAEEGSERAGEMADRLDRINANARDVRKQVDILADRTAEIDEIVDVINGIADQTNMLALNASIEAARAGGQSEGFAVVADEVKSLAEESKDQVSEIEELVESIQSETEDAADELDALEAETEDELEASKRALDTFDQIEEIVRDVSEALDEVNLATDNQAESADMLSMMIDEADHKAKRVSDEISAIAAANETQREALKRFAEQHNSPP